MYKFMGKKNMMYMLDVKLNSNCPDSEKTGSGPGSCGGSGKESKEEIRGKIYIDENGNKFDFSDPHRGYGIKEAIAFQKYLLKKRNDRMKGISKPTDLSSEKSLPNKISNNKKDIIIPISTDIAKAYSEKVLVDSLPKLTDSEKEILMNYTKPDSDEIETSFEYINTYANNMDEAPETTIEAIKSIDNIMKKTSLPLGRTYRGSATNEAESILNSGKAGYKLPGFISTSIDKNIAKDFGSKYILEIEIPKGSKGVFLTEGMADTPHEKELLLDRDYAIVALSKSVDKETGKIIIHSKIT